MGVDGGIPGRAGQVLVLAVSDVHPGSGVSELLGQAEVYEEELIAVPADAHEEVVRFYIAVDERLAVDVLDAADHLVGQHQDSFDGEPAGAEVEQILKRRTQQIHDENIMIFFLAIISAIQKNFLQLQCVIFFKNVKHNFQIRKNVSLSTENVYSWFYNIFSMYLDDLTF